MLMSTPALSPKLDEPELAKALKLKPATLRAYRHQGKGPPFIKIGRRVIYDAADVEAWLAANRRSAAPTGGRGYLA